LQLSDIIGIIPVSVMSIWLIRLVCSEHLRRHRMLFLLLASFVASFAASVFLLQRYAASSAEYRYFVLSMDAIQWGLWVAVLAETATLVVSGYRGFVRLGELILRTGLSISAMCLLFLWTLAPSEWIGETARFWTFETYVVYGSLSLLAVFFALFAAYFRLVPDHNTMLIYGVSTIILISNVTTVAVWNHSTFYADLGMHFVCFGAGAWLFEPAQQLSLGGTRPADANPTPAIRHLESMNEALARLLS